MNAFLRPRKPPFIRGEPGQHGDQWLMTEADLEDYARADRAQRVPLTEAEIMALSNDCYDGGHTNPLILFGRAVERAHKIGAKP